MTPLISIIVPVYNSEKTLCRCVDSVINQPFNNWEILLIDDGSTDKSFEICENYALKDKRITVLHKENGGVSSARNIGLDNAKGKWVTFIDSDDYIAVDALSMDYNTLDEDLLLFPYYSINNGKESLVKIGNEQIIKDHHDLICFYNEYLLCTILRSPWSKFFKKNIIGSLRFDNNMRVGEDTLFMLDFIKKTNSCAILDRPFYIYNECENLFYSKYKLSIEEAIYSMDKLFQSYDKLGLINKQVEKYIFLDYKLYCYNDVCKRHDLWFNDSTVKKSYNRIKRYLGFNYRLRYFLLSNHIFFRYLMIFRGFIDVKK